MIDHTIRALQSSNHARLPCRFPKEIEMFPVRRAELRVGKIVNPSAPWVPARSSYMCIGIIALSSECDGPFSLLSSPSSHTSDVVVSLLRSLCLSSRPQRVWSKYDWSLVYWVYSFHFACVMLSVSGWGSAVDWSLRGTMEVPP